MLPLTMAKKGETVTIRKIGGSEAVRQHLSELGFVTEEQITVVSENNGNLIVQVKDSRIALDRGMAEKISIMMNQAPHSAVVPNAGQVTYGATI